MKFKLLPISILILGLSACGGEEASNHTKDAGEESDKEPTTEVTGDPINEMADFKFHTMLANLPSPLETFHIMSKVDVELVANLTPIEKAANLNTSTAKAYGYGMYMADMGFMAYEHQNQKVLDYYQVCRELANSLGAGEVFDRTISQNFEENTSNEQQFVQMMDNAFNSMDEYMLNNERFINATEIFVGSWVESQIIATRVLKGKSYNDETQAIYDGIFAQKQHASNLMNVLGEVDTEIDTRVLTSVEDLMMFYAGFSTVENLSQKDLAELEIKLENLKTILIG